MVKKPLHVEILGERDYSDWNHFVARSADGSVYSTPEYLGALCEAAGGSFRILVARRGGDFLGGVALYERRSRLCTYVSPRLLLYYNGFVLRPYETRYPFQRAARQNETLGALAEGLSGLGYGRIALRCSSSLTDVRILLNGGWRARPDYSLVVPLTDMDALRGRIEQNLRRLINRCEGRGLSVTEDDDFESFFHLHSQVHARKGVPLYLPQQAFRRYFERLRSGGLARLFHARLPNGQSVSAQLVLVGAHPVSHTVSAASDAAYQELGATAFLRWSVFQRLAELGVTANDLTDAALNPVTHFKAQLGGDLRICLYLEAPESDTFRWERRLRNLVAFTQNKARGARRRLLQVGTRLKRTR